MFLREEASESTVIVCPVPVKENLSKYTLSFPLGDLEWKTFPPDVVAQ